MKKVKFELKYTNEFENTINFSTEEFADLMEVYGCEFDYLLQCFKQSLLAMGYLPQTVDNAFCKDGGDSCL